MAIRRAKNSSTMAQLTRRLSPDVAAVVRGKKIDLRGVSLFCRRQAECAALFGNIVQVRPGVFVLKSPFKENFVGSLFVYYWPNAVYSPEEMVAMALIRHANWYLKTRDTDALRARPGAKQLSRRLFGHVSYGPATYLEGIVRPTGEFTRDPEADGTSAILGWQDVSGNPPGADIKWIDRLDETSSKPNATQAQPELLESEQNSAEVVEMIWLPPRDSNPDMLIQSQLSCR
jgi:hypothetical protein